MLLDGTVVDDEDYFQTLPAQTLFVFRSNGETFQTGINFLVGYISSQMVPLITCRTGVMYIFTFISLWSYSLSLYIGNVFDITQRFPVRSTLTSVGYMSSLLSKLIIPCVISLYSSPLLM